MPRTLAQQLATCSGRAQRRCPPTRRCAWRPTAKIVETNRTVPPDFINIKVDELSGGKPFRHIDDLISQEELRRMSEEYKRIAGFALEPTRGEWTPDQVRGDSSLSCRADPQSELVSSGSAACGPAVLLDRAILHRHGPAPKASRHCERASACSSRCIRPCISLGSISIWKLRGLLRPGGRSLKLRRKRPLGSGDASTSVTSSGSSPSGSCAWFSW